MAITEKEIKRINELVAKSKTPEGLTEEEKQEQAQLRRKYLDSVRENLRNQLAGYKYEGPKDDN